MLCVNDRDGERFCRGIDRLIIDDKQIFKIFMLYIIYELEPRFEKYIPYNIYHYIYILIRQPHYFIYTFITYKKSIL